MIYGFCFKMNRASFKHGVVYYILFWLSTFFKPIFWYYLPRKILNSYYVSLQKMNFVSHCYAFICRTLIFMAAAFR